MLYLVHLALHKFFAKLLPSFSLYFYLFFLLMSYLCSLGFILKILFINYYVEIKPLSMLFHGIYMCPPLFYKQLPSKVKLLRLILNVYFIGFQLFSEGKLYSSTSLISNHCIAYRNNIVSRRNIWAHSGARRRFF